MIIENHELEAQFLNPKDFILMRFYGVKEKLNYVS
jgi:hypothetical protein